MINIADAICSLNPTAQIVIRGNDLDTCTIEWHNDTPEISKADIKTEMDRLQAEYDALEWKRNRKAEYPSIEECVHAILDDDLENLQILRQAVKDKYSK
tara:strand:+ start:271 stop:567 length:297 start_codon:yes stop_codon:yes gene_type:complete